MSIARRYSGVLRFSMAVIALACGGTLLAQEPGGPSSAMPAVARTSARPYPGLDLSKTMTFDFQDAKVDAVLASMSESLGFVVISTALPEQRVTVHIRKELGAEEAVRTLNAILSPLHYVAVISTTSPPSGKAGSTILRVVTTSDGAKSHMPVIRGANPDEIPITDNLRTQIIPIDTISAVGLLNEIRSFLGGADVTADAASNSIVITDTSAKIHRLVEIIHTLDTTPRPRQAFQMKQLQNARAAEAAQLINAIFSPPSAAGPAAAGVATVISGAATSSPTTGRGGTGASTTITSRLTANSDARTNMIILSGPDDQMLAAMDILNRLDVMPADELNTTIILLKRLNYTNAAEVSSTLNQIFGSGTGAAAADTTTSRGLTMNRSNGSAAGNTGGGTRGGSGAGAARGGLGRAGQ